MKSRAAKKAQQPLPQLQQQARRSAEEVLKRLQTDSLAAVWCHQQLQALLLHRVQQRVKRARLLEESPGRSRSRRETVRQQPQRQAR